MEKWRQTMLKEDAYNVLKETRFSKFITVRMYLVIYAQIIEIVEFCAYD